MIALTGTPGVGKTTLAAVAVAHGWTVVDLKKMAHEIGAVVAFDEADQADVLDLDILATSEFPKGNVLVEGHLSHLMPVDAIWVIRLDPGVLRQRLAGRGYSDAKVVENLEAEALDIILQEALDQGVPVVQRDGTRRTPEELWTSFTENQSVSPKGYDIEAVDWSDRLPV